MLLPAAASAAGDPDGDARSEQHGELRVDVARMCTALRGGDALAERRWVRRCSCMLSVTELEMELTPTAPGKALRRLGDVGGSGSGQASHI